MEDWNDMDPYVFGMEISVFWTGTATAPTFGSRSSRSPKSGRGSAWLPPIE